MPDSPVPWMRAQITDRAISVLQPIVVGLQTEAGAAWTTLDGSAYTVPFFANWPDEAAAYPAVIVTITLGDMAAGYALGRIDTDETQAGQTNTGEPIYGGMVSDTLITLTVAALNDAQRTYLVDVLIGGILYGYWTDPTTGRPVDQVVRLWLAGVGISLKTVRKARFPDPRADDPRPEGQRFDAAIDLVADVWVTTLGSSITPGTLSVQQTATLDDATALYGQPSTLTLAP